MGNVFIISPKLIKRVNRTIEKIILLKNQAYLKKGRRCNHLQSRIIANVSTFAKWMCLMLGAALVALRKLQSMSVFSVSQDFYYWVRTATKAAPCNRDVYRFAEVE